MKLAVENLRIIIDAIENNPDLYDQTEWGAFSRTPNGLLDCKCSTPGCLSGWAEFLFPQVRGFRRTSNHFANVLEITIHFACLLTNYTWPVAWFHKVGMEGDPLFGDRKPTADEAVTILKAMADEGSIWDR